MMTNTSTKEYWSRHDPLQYRHQYRLALMKGDLGKDNNNHTLQQVEHKRNMMTGNLHQVEC